MVHSREITDIKSITTSYKSCKFTSSGCILETKFGKLTLSVPDVVNFMIVVKAKKISGNGKISINNKIHVVQSKMDELPISSDERILEIRRPADATGEVAILGLTIYLDSEGVALKNKWKNLIAKCGEYKSIRMVGDRLYASTGAVFTNAQIIKRIETVPPDITYLDNGTLKFSGPCEIIDIVIVEGVNEKKSFDEFVHLDSPGPNILLPAPLTSNPFESRLRSKQINMYHPPLTVQQVSPEQEEFNNILYNSDSIREFNSAKHGSNKNGLIKYLKSNGKDFLVVKRGGVFTVSISNLQSNAEYLVQITAQKLSGNGKIQIGILSDNAFLGQGCLIENVEQNKSIKIKTTTSSSQKLQVRMMEDGVGEVLVSKIIILTKNPNEIASYVPLVFTENTNRFVIVIPSYKNLKWCDKNIQSVINQNYQNYRVIYTDDNSPDGTFDKVSAIVNASNKAHKFKLIKNSVRLGALHNLYNMITSCDDDEIILTLDGDDWLSSENVLNTLNSYYSKEDIWMTYGQYKNYPDNGMGISRQIPDNIIQTKSYRKHGWCSSHLRTFYAWLFKKIKLEDLKYQDEFMAMTWDMTMMFPMLEMSGTHSKFIPDILYVYNLENPINDHKVNISLQQKLDHYVRNMPLYEVLPFKPVTKTNIGLLLIATNRYDKFVPGLISSADNYFLCSPHYNVTYFLFTDKPQQIKTNRKVIQIPISHRNFPFASMDRFKHFNTHANMFETQDYLFYVDVDCLFVDHVSKEVLGNLVGVRHCGFFNKPGPYETNKNSTLYVDERYPRKYQYYFGGGFSGGKKEEYLKLARWCSEKIDQDVSNGIIPIWHDETALNRYFLDNEPNIILTPSYHYPESNVEGYKSGWAPFTFNPKIILLDKNHTEVRK